MQVRHTLAQSQVFHRSVRVSFPPAKHLEIADVISRFSKRSTCPNLSYIFRSSQGPMFNTRAFHQFLDRGHHLPGYIPTGLASLRYSVTQDRSTSALGAPRWHSASIGDKAAASPLAYEGNAVAYSPSCTDQ